MRVPVSATVKEIGRKWYGGNRGRWFYFINLTNIVANGQPIPDQSFGQGVWTCDLSEGQTVQFIATLSGDGQSISYPALQGSNPLSKEEVKANRRESREAKKKLLETFSEDEIKVLKNGYYTYAELVAFSIDELEQS
jgi:hypothetical protein